jgi:hypothetical protein
MHLRPNRRHRSKADPQPPRCTQHRLRIRLGRRRNHKRIPRLRTLQDIQRQSRIPHATRNHAFAGRPKPHLAKPGPGRHTARAKAARKTSHSRPPESAATRHHRSRPPSARCPKPRQPPRRHWNRPAYASNPRDYSCARTARDRSRRESQTRANSSCRR